MPVAMEAYPRPLMISSTYVARPSAPPAPPAPRNVNNLVIRDFASVPTLTGAHARTLNSVSRISAIRGHTTEVLNNDTVVSNSNDSQVSDPSVRIIKVITHLDPVHGKSNFSHRLLFQNDCSIF